MTAEGRSRLRGVAEGAAQQRLEACPGMGSPAPPGVDLTTSPATAGVLGTQPLQRLSQLLFQRPWPQLHRGRGEPLRRL